MSHLENAHMKQLTFDWPQGKLTYRTEQSEPYTRRTVWLSDMHAYNACRIAAGNYDGWGCQGLADDSREWARYVWVFPGSDGYIRLMGLSQGVLALFEIDGRCEGFDDGRWLAIPREWTPNSTHLIEYLLGVDSTSMRVCAGNPGAFGNRGPVPEIVDGEIINGKQTAMVELTPPPTNPPVDNLLMGAHQREVFSWRFTEEDAKHGCWCDLATIDRALACYREWMVDNKPVGWPYAQGRSRQSLTVRISGDGFLELTMCKGDSRGLILVSGDRRIYD